MQKIEKMRFENVGFGFDGDEPLFQNVDFDFPMNQICWLKAPVGKGRSILLQILAGLLNPTFGRYIINEEDIGSRTFEEFLPLRLKIGYGFDYGGLLNNKSIGENIAFPLVYHGLLSPEMARKKVENWLEKFQYKQLYDLRPAQVTGGVRKLSCLLRALVLEPDLLLLDDPTVGLNQDQVLTFFDLIGQLRSESKCQHVFMSSFDERTMAVINPVEIYIENKYLFLGQSIEKKVVHL